MHAIEYQIKCWSEGRKICSGWSYDLVSFIGVHILTWHELRSKAPSIYTVVSLVILIMDFWICLFLKLDFYFLVRKWGRFLCWFVFQLVAHRPDFTKKLQHLIAWRSIIFLFKFSSFTNASLCVSISCRHSRPS